MTSFGLLNCSQRTRPFLSLFTEKTTAERSTWYSRPHPHSLPTQQPSLFFFFLKEDIQVFFFGETLTFLGSKLSIKLSCFPLDHITQAWVILGLCLWNHRESTSPWQACLWVFGCLHPKAREISILRVTCPLSNEAPDFGLKSVATPSHLAHAQGYHKVMCGLRL